MSVITPLPTDFRGNPIATGSRKELGRNDFLNLLITQLTHQDPMKPMEDTEFISQLAQFSSLEQMQNINSSLGDALDWDYLQMQTINNTMATSLIGKEVKADYEGIYLGEDNQPKITFTTDQYARDIRVEIIDENGVTVRVLTQDDIPAGTNTITWDGRDSQGNRVTEGYYQVDITAYDAEDQAFSPSTFLQGKVEGVVYRNGSAYLQVEGVELPLSDITAIYEATSDDDEG
jgi:flagellar basal-body rod modification protein FlgD